MARIIQLPKMQRDAEVRAQSFQESDNTVEVVWTTGSTGRRVSWLDGEFDEELVVNERTVRLGRLNAGAPFLDTHQRYTLDNVIGSVVPGSARLQDGIGLARIALSRAEGAQDRVAKVVEGTIKNVSVGYRIYAVEKTEREGSVPLHRVIDWEPMEISAVPIPFDPGAQVRSLSEDPHFTCRVEASVIDANYNMRMRMQMQHRMLGLC